MLSSQVTHYTRSDYSEPPPVHPPFQHQVRMQIRKLISQSEKNRRHRGDTDHADHHHQQSENTAAPTVPLSSGTGGNSRKKIEQKRQQKSNNAKMAMHDENEIVRNSIVIANKMADLGSVESDIHSDDGNDDIISGGLTVGLKKSDQNSIEMKTRGGSSKKGKKGRFHT